jgi:hypothetical protein
MYRGVLKAAVHPQRVKSLVRTEAEESDNKNEGAGKGRKTEYL